MPTEFVPATAGAGFSNSAFCATCRLERAAFGPHRHRGLAKHLLLGVLQHQRRVQAHLELVRQGRHAQAQRHFIGRVPATQLLHFQVVLPAAQLVGHLDEFQRPDVGLDGAGGLARDGDIGQGQRRHHDGQHPQAGQNERLDRHNAPIGRARHVRRMRARAGLRPRKSGVFMNTLICTPISKRRMPRLGLGNDGERKHIAEIRTLERCASPGLERGRQACPATLAQRQRQSIDTGQRHRRAAPAKLNV